MSERWIKLYEKLEYSSIYHDSQMVHLWIHILIKATKFGNTFQWNGEEVFLNPGQFITGRKKLSAQTGISESKIQRCLKLFEKWHMIEQQTSTRNRLITVLNWDRYQSSEQQMNNKRTTSEQQVNTIKKERKKKEENNTINPIQNIDAFIYNMPESIKSKWTEKQIESKTEDLVDYCNRSGKKYKCYYSALRTFLKKDFPEGAQKKVIYEY